MSEGFKTIGPTWCPLRATPGGTVGQNHIMMNHGESFSSHDYTKNKKSYFGPRAPLGVAPSGPHSGPIILKPAEMDSPPQKTPIHSLSTEFYKK